VIDMPGTDDRVRSLATMRDGETRVVEHILFDLTRARCAALGIREGDRIRCRLATVSQLYVETDAGRIVTIDRDWGSFIQVSAPLADVSAPTTREDDEIDADLYVDAPTDDAAPLAEA
jgi:hypothetical protein